MMIMMVILMKFNGSLTVLFSIIQFDDLIHDKNYLKCYVVVYHTIVAGFQAHRSAVSADLSKPPSVEVVGS